MSSYSDEFPTLTIYHEQIEHQIVELYLNLCRKNDHKCIRTISNKLDALLSFFKTSQNSDHDNKPYISLLYKMIAQTRDISYGKGEKDLTYMLICVWYKHFPISAIFALRTLVDNMENINLHSPYGSWCDIKYFCRYVKLHSMLDPTQNEQLIDSALGILNNQINKDRINWNKTLCEYFEEVVNNPSTLSKRPIGRDHMSFASKWSPRENSSFGWLYERMVIQWTQMFTPALLNVSKDKRKYTINKCKKNYRRMTSSLNKELDTVQIKQCNNKWNDVNPESVSIGTIIKQKNAFVKSHNDDRNACKTHFFEYYDELKEFGEHEHHNTKTLLPVSKIVSCVMTLLQMKELHNADMTYINKQLAWYNHIWNKNIKHKNGFDSSIPIIDISWDIDNDSRNSAIGLGVLIAQRSDLHRFIIYENTAYWIVIDKDDSFCDILQKVHDHSKHPTNSNIDNAFSMLLEAFNHTISHNDTIQHQDARSNITFFIFNGGKHVNIILKRLFSSSFFVFWNIQRNNFLKIKHTDFSPNNFYLCGDSISNIDDIAQFGISYLRNTTLYKFISNILSLPRYSVMDKYLKDGL